MRVAVHLFARARELAGADTLEVELPSGATVAELRSVLVERVPALGPLLAVSAIAVNHDFAPASCVLKESDEVAVIPPVSGG